MMCDTPIVSCNESLIWYRAAGPARENELLHLYAARDVNNILFAA